MPDTVFDYPCFPIPGNHWHELDPEEEGTSITSDPAKLPTATATGGNLVFTFVRDQTSLSGTTTLAIELGGNLTDWTQIFPVPGTATVSNPGLTVVKDSPVPGKDTVTLTLPLVPSGKTFVRLKVSP